MKLKRMFFTVVFAVLVSVAGYSAEAVAKGPSETNPTEAPEVRIKELTKRLEEIRDMDIKSMTRKEKRALRKEVRSIDREMKAMQSSGGVYISVGALLIIILVLILLL